MYLHRAGVTKFVARFVDLLEKRDSEMLINLLRYTEHDAVHNSEEFSSASRSLKKGFITSGIVSAAVWASTLLQSATVTLLYGVGGPWWYAISGGSQIALFAQNAVMIKRNAPGAHTFCEFIGYRWGPWLHSKHRTVCDI